MESLQTNPCKLLLCALVLKCVGVEAHKCWGDSCLPILKGVPPSVANGAKVKAPKLHVSVAQGSYPCRGSRGVFSVG